jgi:Icc-related predicted phosphoesterase
LAVADVHSPKFLEEFRRSLSSVEKPDLMLLAGDVINFGKVSEYRNVLDAIDTILGSDFPIIACFGNEEHEEIREELVTSLKERVKFLDEESVTISLDNQTIGIVVTPAPLNRYYPKGIQDEKLRSIFEQRVKRISDLLKSTQKESDLSILLTHYSPLVESEVSEDSDSFSWWISQAINKVQPNLVIHGHVHHSERPEVIVGKTRVINVAFPATKKVTEILL